MKTVIGIVGPIASGKDEVAKYISEKYRLQKFEISTPLKDLAARRGYSIDRPSLNNFSNVLAQEKGADYLARISLGNISDTGIISGMRQIAQIDYLRKNSRLILICVNADPIIRFNRAKERKKLGEAESFEEFVNNEIEQNSGNNIQRLFEVMKTADYKLTNNNSLEEIVAEADKIMENERIRKE